MCIMLLRLSQ